MGHWWNIGQTSNWPRLKTAATTPQPQPPQKSGSDLEDSKWSKPITSKKSEALVSMWADAEDTLNLYPSPPLSRDSHGKHRNERRKSDSQHSHHKKRENVSPRKTKHNHDSTPRVRRDSPTHEDDEDNERGPRLRLQRHLLHDLINPRIKQLEINTTITVQQMVTH